MPRISKNLKTGVCQIEFELDEAEYAAMGRVTAHWAYLEHVILSETKAIADSLKVELPNDALNMSFTRRLGALRILGAQHAEEIERRRIESLIGRIANAEQDRHKMTHALWGWDLANPERINASSFRPRLEFEKNFDAAALHRLADQLGQISFALQYPKGWDTAFAEALASTADAEGNVAFFSMSRDFARRVAKTRLSPGVGLAETAVGDATSAPGGTIDPA